LKQLKESAVKIKNIHKVMFTVAVLGLTALTVFAAEEVSTYLIMNDIPPYKRLTQAFDAYTDKLKTIPGYTIYSHPGVLAGADHFAFDHTDMTYETDYQSEEIGLGAEVQVTKHTDPNDSLRWLLHEVEGNFRKNPEKDNFMGVIREINGNRIFTYVRGTHYNWISNNIVVDIRYTDLQKTKPEPIEVISAYLQKHPSTMPAMVMNKAHDEKWIKDEMDRRLWLCDKWFLQITLKKAEEKQVYQEAVKSMTIFLNYREKYYGLKAADEKNLLAGYLNTNNGTGIKAKLTEYKDWWSVNKSKAISLP